LTSGLRGCRNAIIIVLAVIIAIIIIIIIIIMAVVARGRRAHNVDARAGMFAAQYLIRRDFPRPFARFRRAPFQGYGRLFGLSCM
jgi:hypothetical protein